MSCFESSTFLKNPKIMNRQVLIDACKKLGWEYKIKHEELFVYNANQKANLRGEYALKVRGNTVSFNKYYIKNGQELVQELQTQFYALNVEYAEQSIVQAFEKVGFRVRKDWDFKANAAIAKQFFMVTETRLQEEEERTTIIQFSILKDGTVKSDSNYLPQDVHDLADKAMEALDAAFGSTRREGIEIKRKAIPEKYKGKTYCSASGQIKSKQQHSTSNKINLKR
ncbi:MAG: hypothetical protein AB8E82_20080 [Aureispira sp.]